MGIVTRHDVPFLDLREQHRPIWEDLKRALDRVLESSQFVLGPEVEQFERAFAGYIGTEHCVGLNSGTSALHLALRACDIGAGDEVITTPLTWVSTSWAISYVGATPVYVDIDPQTYNINHELAAQAITSRTRAILPVHLYGQSCNLEELTRLAVAHELLLIEDAAQAHGAVWNGKRVGSIGHVGCFSFYPGKNLGALGEAGAVTTNLDHVADRIRRLRDHAQESRHHHVEIGYNMRMESIQGAVLRVKLGYLNGWNAARRRVAERYRQLMAGIPGLTLPIAACSESHVWHAFVVLVDQVERDRVRESLATYGISTGVHYPTLVPHQSAYATGRNDDQRFPVAERVSARCLSLPMFAEMTDAQIEKVSTAMREIMHESTQSGRTASGAQSLFG